MSERKEANPQMRLMVALMNKSAYPQPVTTIQLVQTHISLVFITDDYVYKIKKPANYGFLDFSTLEKRRYYCMREVELNKRLSPDIYLAVSPVTQHGSSVRLEGEGEVIEYAVKMRRMPMERIMKRLLLEGHLTRQDVERVARRIAQFHAEAASSKEIDHYGSVDVVKTNTDENFTQTEKYVGKTITRSQFDTIREFTTSYLQHRQELFEGRISDGRIKDCHGDLHLEHVCITEPIRIFDCIEFNDRFRYSDTAADISFLAMDLDYNGRRDLSDALMDAYVKYSGDEGVLGLMNFYKVYRAYVRGKVVSFLLDSADSNVEEAIRTARKYFNLAESYVQEESAHSSTTRPCPNLIITCGLMGTGKSTIAKTLAKEKRWMLVSSDQVRKELAGIPASHHEYVAWGKGIYSKDFSERTYNRMNEIAEKHLRMGRSIILDASYGKRSERGKAYALAKATDAKFTCIEMVCSEHEIERRLTRRERGADQRGVISDGRWAIFQDQKATFEKVDDFTGEEHLILNTGQPRATVMKQLFNELKGRTEAQSKNQQ